MALSRFNAPEYLLQYPSGLFIFRLRVPLDCRAAIPQGELRYSLKTRCVYTARKHLATVLPFVQRLFNEVRRASLESSVTIPAASIRESIKGVIKRSMLDDCLAGPVAFPDFPGISVLPMNQSGHTSSANDHPCFPVVPIDQPSESPGQPGFPPPDLVQPSPPLPSTEHGDFARSQAQMVETKRQLLSTTLSTIRRRNGVTIGSSGSLPPQTLYTRPHQGDPRRQQANTCQGQEIPRSTQGKAMETPGPSNQNARFSDLQRAFLKEKEMAKGWREKTEEDHKAVFSLFVEIFGDLPVDNINKATMREFKSTIIQLPPNMRKIPRFAKKSVQQIIAMKPGKTLSAHTVNKYLSRLSNLFSYAVSHGFMTVNPAGGFKVKLQSRPDEEREAYTVEDLKKLFSPPDVSQPSRYWAPLITLFAGCRLEEICQLHIEDIRQEEGTWVFDINNKGEKVLKNLSSVRLVPIHPQLIALGLLDYADRLRTKGEARLFPELHRRRDGYGQVISKWFQYFKKLRGIGPGKTFHSFRHTFITHLRHKQVDPFMIHEIDGHAINSETMDRYGKRYAPEILLREAIEKIDYGLDLPRVYRGDARE